ncbi:Phthiotriol/phenolphthiotriol dimycocerosates methyltransferase [Seminavis robusta]|uniref:Phthiotriol/phenolphthiotriol dimycocerosates methyltransferase n=1 Tax=Seminavis robusta TaxID=568900 RepID=A0A9N8EYZ4_9STRA|nr:Phthiotriol/phenolphthiotriol dimycocerosates methyltransferase [Seminavis robusta]|eukprot:Sro1976_g308850.1 Phthiotriol/phenolphthiotriol dimycocerosates methyltransferase (190) ;mRNA; r:2579-3148
MLFGRKSSPRASPLPLKKSDDPGPIKPKKKCTLKMLALGLVGIMFFRFFLTMAGRIVFSTFVFVASFDKSGSLDRFVNHAFYQILDGLDTQGELTCMNWGYVDLSPDAPKIEMDASDEPERWCLQMYNKIASAPGDLTGLNVLEVGSGRGGGSSYTKRYLHPAKMTGLDYSSKAVDFLTRKTRQKHPRR